jgi:hypothetical protein
MGLVQNNNGNYSLRLVPIHLLQPRPQSASGYCYSGRLLLHFLRSVPATHGFQALPVTALPSCCPFFRLAAEFRDEVSFRHILHQPRRVFASFSVHFGAEALCSLKPCDSVFERTFPVSIDLLNIHGPGPFCSDFGSPDAQTRRSE